MTELTMNQMIRRDVWLTMAEVPYVINLRTGEVHREGCRRMPDRRNQDALGTFRSCEPALVVARTNHPGLAPDGCGICCPEGHTR